MDFEFSKKYSHVIISGQSKQPEKVLERVKETIGEFLTNGLEEKHFNRIKKKIYGDYVAEYNNIADVSRMFLSDSMKGICAFDYIEQYNIVTKEYTEQVLKEIFDEKSMAIAVVK